VFPQFRAIRQMGRRLRVPIMIVGLMVLGITMLPEQTAGAANEMVTNCNGSGPGSLPSVVGAAASGDTIRFSLSCSQIVLSKSIRGKAYSWGRSMGPSPVAVAGLPSDVSVVQAANWGGLAIAGGNVYQWDRSKSPTATEITGPTDATSVGEGYYFSAAAATDGTRDGQLWTWGENSAGDLCQGSVGGTRPPARVFGAGNVVQVSGGASHLLILDANGTVRACGENASGELGDGTFDDSDVPVKVKGLSGCKAISSGNLQSDALCHGKVYDWGNNEWGQLGNGSTTNSDLPVEVNLQGRASEIYAGGDLSTNGQSIALVDGVPYAWGNDSWGQLGNRKEEPDSTTPIPVEVPKGVTYSFVATGGETSYGVTSSGDVYAWGDNSTGELGNGKTGGVHLRPELGQSGFTQFSTVANIVVGLRMVR
jgi:hypothetical protein